MTPTDDFLNNKKKQILRWLSASAILYSLIILILSIYWSITPSIFDVNENAKNIAEQNKHQMVVGYTSVATEYKLMSLLLDKSGGFISNDYFLPGIWTDNIRNWEYGALIQIRDFSRSLRKDFSRSQTQSVEDFDLSRSEPNFNFNHTSWSFPSSESEYRKGLEHLKSYLNRLQSRKDNAYFYARADNLTNWLGDVSTRLGSISQRLSASVGQARLNIDNVAAYHVEQDGVSSIKTAEQANTVDKKELDKSLVISKDNKNDLNHSLVIKTPWLQIDNVFYEAKGQSYALLHLLKAIEIDFKDILENKNAAISLQQIIRELEVTQQSIYSPMIMNGSGFGIFANHSLVMANYISRANASLIELRQLLNQG